MRQIVLDTETTGLDVKAGHRVIEIGCVEIIERRLTGRNFHVYINPDRKVDEGAIAVHGITDAFLIDQPRFNQIVDRFIEFIKGAELIIHNATFDVSFLNQEFFLASNQSRKNNQSLGLITDYCAVVDTLVMARARHPGQRNNLDALCKRYGIDNSKREFHGALLDAEILADVYLAMTGGQVSFLLDEQDNSDIQEEPQIAIVDVNNLLKRDIFSENKPLKVISATSCELALHIERLNAIAEVTGKISLWEKLE